MHHALARLLCSLLAFAAIAWAVETFPTFWAEAALAQVSRGIIAGEVYRPEAIKATDANVTEGRYGALRPAMRASAAVVRLRAMELAIASGKQDAVAEKTAALNDAVTQTLRNAPSDPYQWMVLYWLENTRDGLKTAQLRYLQMSYDLGFNEGWIGLRRNRLAMAIYPTLTDTLRTDAVNEFVGLVRSPLFPDAVDVIAGPGWPEREQLLERVNELKEAEKRPFLKRLFDRDVDGIKLPMSDEQRRRPWR